MGYHGNLATDRQHHPAELRFPPSAVLPLSKIISGGNDGIIYDERYLVSHWFPHARPSKGQVNDRDGQRLTNSID